MKYKYSTEQFDEYKHRARINLYDKNKCLDVFTNNPDAQDVELEVARRIVEPYVIEFIATREQDDANAKMVEALCSQ